MLRNFVSSMSVFVHIPYVHDLIFSGVTSENQTNQTKIHARKRRREKRRIKLDKKRKNYEGKKFQKKEKW